MKSILIKNLSHPPASPIIAAKYDTFFLRLKGLMFRKSLDKIEGILLSENMESRTNASIHMLFMNFDIAVIWINAQQVVVDKQLARKWNLMYIPKKPARYILETHPERLEDFHLGDQLVFETI